ncbi:hypothetical protein BDY21DRAFT_360517 [Lineolata rhizophorae]|uniref:Uncharacterized protein n=1 Tax=Lineolata rhizophorae TaxID=578093 RepID=A0A6A6PC13_9PEZI|nr:hypothetical protein BDY21DRAFT_360517 [Lineolata rhizophorae]
MRARFYWRESRAGAYSPFADPRVALSGPVATVMLVAVPRATAAAADSQHVVLPNEEGLVRSQPQRPPLGARAFEGRPVFQGLYGSIGLPSGNGPRTALARRPGGARHRKKETMRTEARSTGLEALGGRLLSDHGRPGRRQSTVGGGGGG